MSYASRYGRRPREFASKDSHSHIINDAEIVSFLEKCRLPIRADEVEIPSNLLVKIESPAKNQVKKIIALDGGYTEVTVKKDFPSSMLSFIQFGALVFSVSDLEEISKKEFIDPADMARLKEVQRYKLALPTKNLNTKDSATLTESVRSTIFDFFGRDPNNNFLETLKWLVYELFDSKKSTYSLSRCPSCDERDVILNLAKMKDYKFTCPKCNELIYLTDILRLQEGVDDELGAGGIVSYLMTTLEQIAIVHIIRLLIDINPAFLKETLFVKDGPLGFFGQTANMHKPMRALAVYLYKKHDLFLVGLEKSGAFVEHADEIKEKLKPNSVLLLSNEYIYKYIRPGRADDAEPYGRTSYYGAKLIYKSESGRMHVATLPTKDADVVLNPKKEDFPNMDVILTIVDALKCDMYDNALFPVALVNHLVSLSNHPSSVILEKFAKEKIG